MIIENNINEKVLYAAVLGRVIDALEVSGQLVEDTAKLLCPVDTGNLRGSIHHKVYRNELIVRIGTPVEYAPYLNLEQANMLRMVKAAKVDGFLRMKKETSISLSEISLNHFLGPRY